MDNISKIPETREQPVPIDVRSVLSKGLEENPDSVALASLDREYTWAELEFFSDCLARYYIDNGFKPGDIIATLSRNTPELFIHYLACFRAGLISVTLKHIYTLGDIQACLRYVDISSIVIAQDIGANTKQFFNDNEGIQKIPYETLIDDAVKHHASQSPDDVIDYPTIDPHDPCIIHFSSGSTGSPKGITHSYNSLGHMLSSIAEGYEINEHDTLLPAVHFSAFITTLATLHRKGKALVLDDFAEHKILELLRRYRATILGIAPTGFQNLIRNANTKTEDFQSVRLALTGGYQASTELINEFRRKTNGILLDSYGLTECGISHSRRSGSEHITGSVGPVMPGFQCSIRNEEGEVPIGETGEMWIKSPSNAIGYWNNPVAQKHVFHDEWIRTGDLMYGDGEGNYYFVGRLNNIIEMPNGEKLLPETVEVLLRQHEEIDQAVVNGSQQADKSVILNVFIARAHKVDMSDTELFHVCETILQSYDVEKKIQIHKTFPRTATGKIDRVRIQMESIA
ncbi:acyl--CoA ligase [Patescibacteria group bacterium]|nr:acyl--CoA ligase [Patescibacteria group bacterium]MBU1124365.1 acyl--CoA ligase [Patescibacteria group bacterium]MBU1911130.1 acyl--CoA ligase [Patescibacteria group bacterium]